MKQFLIGAFLLITVGAFAADVESEIWPKDVERVVVRAFYEDMDALNKIHQQRAPWAVDHRKQYFVIDVDQAQYAQLVQMGYRLEFDEQRTTEMNAVRVVSPNQKAGIPGFECYRTVAETLATGAQLASDYPQLATWFDVGNSWEQDNGLGGEDVMVLKLTNSAVTEDKPKLFVMSSIHAREYTTAELNTRFAEYLLESYGEDADATWLLDYHEVHLLLISNPDGRKQAQTGILWRKNTNQNYCSPTSNNRGADLNRNFEFRWGCCGGSSGQECSEVYRGPTPGSEPESAAVMDYVRSIFPDQRGPNMNDAAPLDTQGIFVDVHSFSELVIWPWGFDSTVAPNAAGLQTLGRRLAFFNDYFPAQSTVLGITDGTTDDFAYGDLGVPAYTFELGTSFFQNCGSFESTIYPDNLQSLIYAAKAARAPYLLPAGPDVLQIALSDTVVGLGSTADLSADVDDTRFENSNGVEPTQSIAAARYTVDTPPWEAGATPQSLSATDGSFNTSTEAVQASIDTTGLATGRHTIFVQGQDAAGDWGPVSATFLYVIDPASAPRVSGQVLAADTGLPLAATVSADNFSTTSDAATGDYELLLLPGTYDLTAEPLDSAYGARTVTTFTVEDLDNEIQEILLYPFCEILADDMETTSVAWTTSGSWARTQSQSNSPVTSWTDSPAGNYSNNSNTSLTSPVLVPGDADNLRLDFASRCDTEATYDFCIVEIASDGGNWLEVTRYDGNASSFTDRSIDVSSLAGSSSAQIRFRLDTDISVTDDGWYVDDVVLRASGAQCVTATDTDSDGVNDLLDNCTLDANPDQRDTDGDNIGNLCDADLDNNCAINFLDLGLLKSVFFSVGDQDADFNGDGAVNFLDLGIMKAAFFQAPGPSGLDNACNATP